MLKFSPFKAGCLTVLAACLFFLASDDRKPGLLSALDARVTDSMFRWRGAVPTTGAVVIVDIDEKSLRELGQWPWPRNTLARLVDNVHAAGAKVVGFDVVFAEADRTSPGRFLDELSRQLPEVVSPAEVARVRGNESLDHDQALGRALSGMPSVLGYVFLLSRDGFKDPAATPFPSVNIRTDPQDVPFDTLNLLPAYRAIVNVPAVAQATSEGFFNFFPDEAGMVGKVPMLLSLDGIPYPSLALEILRIGLGEEAITIHVSQLVEAERKGVLGVSIGGRLVTTDDNGQMAINHRGPVGTFPYVSAIDILQGRNHERLLDKYVLIGTSAAGLLDLRATPFSSSFPGVEIQATIIDNILTGDFLMNDPVAERGLTLALMIAGGILLSALLVYCSPLVGGLAGLLMLSLTVIGNYAFFFRDHQVVGIIYPLLVFLAVIFVVTVCNFFFEGRQRRFIDKAFSHYVSPQVVEQLKKNPQQLTLSGEEKELTILFCDIRGFTTISEQMPAEQLGRFMNRYLTAMSSVIFEYKGTVDKFIGDAIMAMWGAPLDDQRHAPNAVRAAMAMRSRLLELAPLWRQEGLPEIGIGIGINSGSASVGNFGSDDRFDYTVIGDNVNLASRLEGLTKFYGVMILLSEQTLAELDGQVFCRLIDRVRVKGKNKPVKIYEPLVVGEPDARLRQEVETFEEALANYFDRKFAMAGQQLCELQAASPQPLYAYYLKRIDSFRNDPPPDDWDGVAVHTRK